MKNIVLSTVAVLAMSSFAVAGGDIAPVEEPVVVVEEATVTDSGFYLGLAYGAGNIESTIDYYEDTSYSTTSMEDESWTNDFDYGTIMLQAGYKFNSYIAIEGRYWLGLDESVTIYDMEDDEDYTGDLNINTWGIYVKPMYPVTDAFDIYALLGYASSEIEFDGESADDDLDGFSWGIGMAYSFNDNLSLFVDYVNMYNDDESYVIMGDGWNGDVEVEDTISTWNFGVTYKF
jgi:opacity protein-like surface antigen